jgi:hypothetical protein
MKPRLKAGAILKMIIESFENISKLLDLVPYPKIFCISFKKSSLACTFLTFISNFAFIMAFFLSSGRCSNQFIMPSILDPSISSLCIISHHNTITTTLNDIRIWYTSDLCPESYSSWFLYVLFHLHILLSGQLSFGISLIQNVFCAFARYDSARQYDLFTLD